MNTKDQVVPGRTYSMKRRAGEIAERVTVLEYLPKSHTVVRVKIHGIDETIHGKENAELDVHIQHLTDKFLGRFENFVANSKKLTTFEI